jgi:hypothetical protein
VLPILLTTQLFSICNNVLYVQQIEKGSLYMCVCDAHHLG